ncbi:MAG: nuclear transport factor 2 family protein [Bacteroidales bacterium]|nr:nuclear transport factor 2 family protein [Bacteroidales bacterium]
MSSDTLPSSSQARLEQLLARQDIVDCIARLARGEDRREADTLKACFWPDATIDFGVFVGPFDQYLSWVVPGDPALPVTLHTLGQTVIELGEDEALAETHVISYHRVVTDGGDRDTAIGGRYLDRLENRGGEWRIAQRTMLYDWFRDFGEAVDWSQGVMGMPFSADHYTGRGDGDFSQTFFKQGFAAGRQG